MNQFHFLCVDARDGKHFVQTVSGPRDVAEAMRAVSGIIVSMADTYQAAAAQAAAMNAANGVVQGGCARC
jgi:hypothetical protein